MKSILLVLVCLAINLSYSAAEREPAHTLRELLKALEKKSTSIKEEKAKRGGAHCQSDDDCVGPAICEKQSFNLPDGFCKHDGSCKLSEDCMPMAGATAQCIREAGERRGVCLYTVPPPEYIARALRQEESNTVSPKPEGGAHCRSNDDCDGAAVCEKQSFDSPDGFCKAETYFCKDHDDCEAKNPFTGSYGICQESGFCAYILKRGLKYKP